MTEEQNFSWFPTEGRGCRDIREIIAGLPKKQGYRLLKRILRDVHREDHLTSEDIAEIAMILLNDAKC
ncbi:hypothetical protein LCGC14_1027840 [marine sediment metagenome]|uniref:Uncharacterized protein n=1 Tax=marine sediment metagenome TaxID=412755 RepID=A0A0F9R1G9_9ZZZZ|nr:hypothetical protein [Candidatus Aminicenantes bacterium]